MSRLDGSKIHRVGYELGGGIPFVFRGVPFLRKSGGVLFPEEVDANCIYIVLELAKDFPVLFNDVGYTKAHELSLCFSTSFFHSAPLLGCDAESRSLPLVGRWVG